MDLHLTSQPVYSLGPLENWLLAVPVHLDQKQGALWGAVIFAVIGVTLAIEAAWSAARWWGAVIVATSVLVLFSVRGDVIVDLVWNPWFGVIWLYTTMASSWAVATGRLRWWPVALVSASIVAQCHEVFAPPAIAVCLTAPVLGVIVRRSRGERVGLGWLGAGAAAGVVSWIALRDDGFFFLKCVDLSTQTGRVEKQFHIESRDFRIRFLGGAAGLIGYTSSHCGRHDVADFSTDVPYWTSGSRPAQRPRRGTPTSP